MNLSSLLCAPANRRPERKIMVLAARRVARFAYDPLSGLGDYVRVRKKYAQLGTRDDLERRFPKDLSHLYDTYTTSVSNRSMAASIELSRLVYSFCHMARPRRIADFGSGFSSVVLRYHKKFIDPDAAVWSIDSSEKWLEETRTFLECYGLPSENLLHWDQMKTDGPWSFDFVFYDLGHVKDLRKDALEDVLGMVAEGGTIVLDDMHFIGYKRHFKKIVDNHDSIVFNLRGFTKDSLGRYSYLLTKKTTASD